MSFINGILLAGAAAFLIPLLIHLLNKRRVVTVRWGAMHLLHQAMRQKKRNVKVEQWLLLLVRIAIPIILALCLARPVISALRQLPGLNKTSLLVLLDNSYSMRAPSDGGTARDRAVADLQRILESLPRGSDVSVVLAGSPARRLLPQPTSALEQIPLLLQKEAGMAGPLALNDLFQLAQSELKGLNSAAREILVISDFQLSDWRNLAEGGTVPALDALKKEEPAPLLTFLRTASELQDNLVLASVEPSAFVVAKGQTIALRARIQNHGQRAYQDLSVHLEADGARLRSTRVSVAPNAETILTLSHAFEVAGDHALTIRLEGDALPEDNAFSLVIPVREQVNCLLVKGKSHSGALEGATDFLEIALSPHHSAAASLKDIIRSGVVDYQSLRDKALDGTEVVIMANVEKLNGKQVGDLEEFVKRGGGLIVFAGPEMDLRWLQQEFYRGGKGLLPCDIQGFGHVEPGQMPARILSQRYSHPAITYFNEARGMKFQDAAFNHWLNFTKVDGEARVLLSLDRSAPLIVEKPFGKGRVLAVATTANAQWTNLPLQPVFVPLMQRLVTYLATQSAAPQSQICGTMLRAPLQKEQAKAVYLLTDPLNQTHELTPRADRDGAIFVDYPATQVPGIYELRPASDPKSITPRRFAFNLSAAESDLTSLPVPKLQEVARRFGAAYAGSFDEYARLDRSRRHGSEVWQPLLFGLLAFLFLEVFLQQRISRA